VALVFRWARGAAFARVASVRLGLALSPVPAHRTEQALFAHRSVDHETDWRIENLVRAVWLIRLQKPGYEDAEVSFDAINNTETSITIKLKQR